MTASLDITTIAAAISNLSVAGLTIHDLDNVPASGLMVTPCLYPRPDYYITNFLAVPDTFGTDGGGQFTVTYSLNYRFLFCNIGAALGGLTAVYKEFIEKLELIIQAIMNDDTITGATDVRMGTIPGVGPVQDASGNVYLGCDIEILVTEYT